MSQKNLWVKPFLIIILIGVLLGLVIFIALSRNNLRLDKETTATILPWSPNETIKLNYAKCKDLNRGLPINRLIKKNFMLPMCPERYVVLYDEYQEIVFIFNEELHENPTILTIDTICDNSSGKC